MTTLPVFVASARLTDRRARKLKEKDEVEAHCKRACPANMFLECILKAEKEGQINLDLLKDKVVDICIIGQQTDFVLKSKLFNLKLDANLPKTVGEMRNLPNVRGFVTGSGGNNPQFVVNEFYERISNGTSDVCIILGGESLATTSLAAKHQVDLSSWVANAHKDVPAVLLTKEFDKPDGTSKIEQKCSLFAPRQVYPMLETAFRAKHHPDRTIKQHNEQIAKLFSEHFNSVAARDANASHSWFPQRKSEVEIATPSPANRWIGFPYTKLMNSVMNVDQYSCVILCGESLATRALGKQTDDLVFLLGCADCDEPNYDVSTRGELGESFAMQQTIRVALQTANVQVEDVSFFDLYSCFPVAVEMACRYLNLDWSTEKRDLTVTGGLPFAGGPGNAYTLFAIAETVRRLNATKSGAIAFVNGNGMFVSRHSCGVYGNQRPRGGKPFSRVGRRELQDKANEKKTETQRVVEPNPSGVGVIEAYTVDHARSNQLFAIGTMLSSGNRFVAQSKDAQVLLLGMRYDLVGVKVNVKSDNQNGARGGSTFSFIESDETFINKRPSGYVEAEISPSKL